MQGALRSTVIYGAEGMKNSSQYMKQDWADKNLDEVRIIPLGGKKEENTHCILI